MEELTSSKTANIIALITQGGNNYDDTDSDHHHNFCSGKQWTIPPARPFLDQQEPGGSDVPLPINLLHSQVICDDSGGSGLGAAADAIK